MTERVAIVTGGLRGLGRGMTLGLARSGVRVVAVGHLPEDGAAMVPPLLYVVSAVADKVNGYRFDALTWDTSLPAAEAARRNGRPAGFVLYPQDTAAFPAA